ALSESPLWSGAPGVDAPHRTPRREAEAALTRSRALFESGAVPEAQSEIERLGASWSQAYLPVGDLSVRLEPAAGADAAGAAAPAAERILDLRRAEHRVLAEDGEHLTVVSAADDVLVHAMPCPEAARPVLELDSPLHEERRESGGGSLTVVLRAPSDVPAGQFRREEEIAWEREGASRAAVVVCTRHEGDRLLVLCAPPDGPVGLFRREEESVWEREWASRSAVVVCTRHEGDRLLVVCAIATTWQGLGRTPDRAVHEALEEATAQAELALARGEA